MADELRTEVEQVKQQEDVKRALKQASPVEADAAEAPKAETKDKVVLSTHLIVLLALAVVRYLLQLSLFGFAAKYPHTIYLVQRIVLSAMGVVLLAAFVPRLARALGTDPRRALWLAALSPLVWLQLVSPAHNDALMVGLLVAGVTLAVERRPLAGIAVCALAATVKVPAAAAIVFIAVAWARVVPARGQKLRVLGQAAVLSVAIAALVTLVTGLGLAWISTGLFNTPGRVRLAITPATAVGYTIAHLLRGAGHPINGKAFEATLNHVAFAITVLFGLVLLYRTRFENLVRCLGLGLVAVAIGGPAAWPWYFIWGLALLAACPRFQSSRAIPLAVAVSVFIVIPTGQLALSLGTSPYMVVVYLLLVCWYLWRRRGGARPGGDTASGRGLAGCGEPRSTGIGRHHESRSCGLGNRGRGVHHQ